MRVCIASCVRRSSLASFLSISRLRSQFARFGAILSKSCGSVSPPPGWYVPAERGTHEVLRLALAVLGDRARRDARDGGLDRVVLVARALPERARLRVEVARELGRRGRVVPGRTLSKTGLEAAAGDSLTRPRRARRRAAGAARAAAACGARTRPRAMEVEGLGSPSGQVNVAVVDERARQSGANGCELSSVSPGSTAFSFGSLQSSSPSNNKFVPASSLPQELGGIHKNICN
jgi:hypothetical protein